MDGSETRPIFFLRDLPRYEELRDRAARYPDLQPASVEATLILMRVATDSMAAFDSYLSVLKMSPGRMSVLTILNRDPSQPLSPSVLAERAGVTRATMTGLLDRLERDKMVKRSLDKKDRRKATVLLTNKGQAFLDTALPGYYKRIASVMANLSETEQRTLTDMLYRVSERVPAIADGKLNGKATAPTLNGHPVPAT